MQKKIISNLQEALMDNDDSIIYQDNEIDLHTELENDFIDEEGLEEKRELERRRAAMRRRKIAARERRRKKRMIQVFVRLGILLLIFILIITGFIMMISGIWKHFHKNKEADKLSEEMLQNATTEAPAIPKIDKKILAKELPKNRKEALEILKKLSKDDPSIKAIYDNAAIYPDRILQHLAANTEMVDYVINYPAKINIIFDGNFSVKLPKKKVPLFLQFDERWGYADYGKNLLAINGSAPTCLSMAHTYLKQDGKMNPIKVADFSVKNGYLDENGKTSLKLMTKGASTLELTSKELELHKRNMVDALNEGNVIICCMDSGDFTKSEHYIVIHSYKDGLFYINDPSSSARSKVGWDYQRLRTQISHMWALSN